MHNRFVKTGILLISLFLWLYACAVPHGPVFEKDGKKYGVVCGNFTGQWYDYYERSLSYMDGEFYDEALCDLTAAIEKRHREKRWANTYGMHFVDYFPHRETGIIHYLSGNYDAAESELELSCTQEPSAKAGFYMDEVRRHIMLRQKKDKSRPDLMLKYLQSTGDDPVAVSGVAKDERYISEIIFSGEKILLEVSDRMVTFRKDLALTEGRHKIDVIARNLLGGEERQTISIHVDRSGPVIVIEKFVPGIVIQGYLYDESGIESFTVNGKQENASIRNNAFEVILMPGMEHAKLVSGDALGNETRADIISETTTDGEQFQAGLRRLIVAENCADISTDFPLQLFPGVTECPEIILKGWPEKETVFVRNVDIEGQARGKGRIKELTIQVEGKSEKYPIINKLRGHHNTGRIISFNQSVSLEQGENRITVRVKEISGRESVKKISIIRQTPRVLQLKHRYSLRMCPFDSKAWEKDPGFFQRLFSRVPEYSTHFRFMETEHRAWFQHLLLGSLAGRNRFQVMAQKELQSYLDEYNLEKIRVISYGQRPLKTPYGLLLGNTCIDRNGIEITARLIDLKTFEEVVAKDVYVNSFDRSALRSMADELSEKFHNALPLISGKISEITENKIHTSFENGKVKEGWPIILYREEAPRYNPVTGLFLGSDTEIIGKATMGKNGIIWMNSRQSVLIRKEDRALNR